MLQLLIVGVILGLLHTLLFRRLGVATGLAPAFRRVLISLLALLWLLGMIAMGAGNLYSPNPIRLAVWLGETWFAVLFYLVLAIGPIALVSGIARLLRFGRREPLVQLLSAAAIVAAVGAAAFGVVEANNFHVVRADVEFDSLPGAFDGLRVAVVSDIHVGAAHGPDFARRVVDLVNSERPDLILLAGDLLDGSVRFVAPDVAPLRGLSARYGVFGVAGNHEGYGDEVDNWMDFWDSIGIRTLRNERAAIEIGGQSIDIAGVYDFDAGEPYQPDLDKALAGQSRDRFTVLIAHQPRQGPAANAHGIDLQVSGHTHGGQLWPLNYVVKWVNGTVAGLDRVGDMQRYTTRGIGTWGPPVRVGAPPDISILTLRTSSGTID